MRRLFCLLLAALAALGVTAAEPPPLMLANSYRADVDVADYWISEKLDGVRGYWDGRQLLTRSGTVVAAPAWFVAGWPALPMDGELWSGRGRFEQASATVRSGAAGDVAWRQMRFMVFDLPAHPGPFDVRLLELRRLLGATGIAWLQPVEQFKLATSAELDAKLTAVVAAGGEGLMLHRGAAPYAARRSDDLLKLKPYEDAEARVLAHLPGHGKYAGLLGALLVERADGLQFRLGGGFSDAQRRDPPPLGSWVTYRYNGLTGDGVPRFARFLRVRDDLPPPDPP